MERFNKQLTCKGLVKSMKNGKINFDCAVQRNKVWDLEKKSLLIHSILYGYSIPAFYLVENDENGYDSLDGKQRSNAIYEFMNNEFILSDKFPSLTDADGNTVEFKGMTFEQLPEWAQDTIKDYSLTIYYYKEITPEEVKEFFYRLNNGKALTAVELNRVKAKSIYTFQEIAKHDAIRAVLSEKAISRFTDENIAMQIYAMINMENPDFGTKNFRPYIQDVEVTEEDKNNIMRALDMVNKFVADITKSTESDDEDEAKNAKRILRKIKSRTHFVSISYLAYLCVTGAPESLDYDKFFKVVFEFFNTTQTTNSASYNSAVGAGSAKPDAVRARKNVMVQMYRSRLA